jgi:hypothetical protein
MRPWMLVSIFALGVLAGCMAAGPAMNAGPAGSSAEPQSPLGSPFAGSKVGGLSRSWPLILDRADVTLGTSVYFNRVPTAAELHDLDLITGVQNVVISLPGWPVDATPLESLAQINPEATGIVLLPGYPPSRQAAAAWNLIPARLRIVAIVDGPPASNAIIDDLNTMRGLERVIVEMDRPSRAGFERLQRPLSFRKVIE